MKNLLLILPLIALPAAALADEQTDAQACLSWGISKMAHNQQLSHVDITDINSERYDEKVGSQHIATQLTATLAKKGDTVGNMLCLLENERPLYVYFSDMQ